MNCAVITAVYDRYDNLAEFLPQTVPTEALVITEDPTFRADGWNTVWEERPGLHPNRAAKIPKLVPWEYTDADFVIWIDASFRIVSPDFVEDIAALGTLSQFDHPWRDCIYDEVEASVHPKYAGEPMRAQVDTYRAAGHPKHWGLWATGVIGRHRTAIVEEMGERWLTEIDRWSFQDQLSQPFVLRELGIRPERIPGVYMHGMNPWIGYEGSERH